MKFEFDISPAAMTDRSSHAVVPKGQQSDQHMANLWSMFGYSLNYKNGKLVEVKLSGSDVDLDLFNPKAIRKISVVIKDRVPAIKVSQDRDALGKHKLLPEAENAILKKFHDKFSWKLNVGKKR